VSDALAFFNALGMSSGVVALAVLLRVGAAMAFLPVMGERLLPQRIRLVVTLAFVAIVAPAVAPEIVAARHAGAGLAQLFVGELVAGLGLGVLIRMMIFSIQIAGSIAAQATSLSQIFGATTIEAQPAIGQILFLAGLTLAVLSGLHVKLAAALIHSYDLFPPGQIPDAADFAKVGVAGVARAFALAFTLAAPFIVASLIYNIALGVINKAMPQLMVAMVGAPAITAGGLVLLLIVSPALLHVWQTALNASLLDPVGAGP